MNNIDKTIMSINVREPKLAEIDGIYRMTEKIVTDHVDAIDDAITEEIIKCIPDDVTQLILVDKQKVIEIFGKQIPKKPYSPLTFGSIGICPICSASHFTKQNHCYNCGQAMDWSGEE